MLFLRHVIIYITLAVFSVFSKILGVILIMTGLFTLAALFIAVFTLGSSSVINVPWKEFIEAGNFTDYPVWIFGLIMFFAVGIPFFFLSLLGFKLLSPNLKSIGNIAKYTLLAIWILSVSLAIAIGIKQASAFSFDGRVVKKETLNLKPTDTLLIKFKHNAYFAKDIDDNDNFKITLDSTGNDVIYSNNVRFKIVQTDTKSAYIQIEKEAKGKTLFEAKQRAEKIQYSYKVIGNQLLFDNYLVSDVKEKFRNQEIEITLFLPLGTVLKMDESARHYDQTDDDYFLWNPENNNEVYKVETDEIKCQNCLNEDHKNSTTDTKQVNDSLVTTTVNGDGDVVTVNKTGSKKGLSIDKDGIIIKNK